MHCYARHLSPVVLVALFTSLVVLQAASAAAVTDSVSHRQGRPHLPRAYANAQTAEASCTKRASMRYRRIHDRMLLHVARSLFVALHRQRSRAFSRAYMNALASLKPHDYEKHRLQHICSTIHCLHRTALQQSPWLVH